MVPDDLFQITKLVSYGPRQLTLHQFTEALLLHIQLGDGLLKELDRNAVDVSCGLPVNGVGFQVIVPHKFDPILLFVLGKVLEGFFLLRLFVRQRITVKDLLAPGNLVVPEIFGVLKQIMGIRVNDQVRPLGAIEHSSLKSIPQVTGGQVVWDARLHERTALTGYKPPGGIITIDHRGKFLQGRAVRPCSTVGVTVLPCLDAESRQLADPSEV